MKPEQEIPCRAALASDNDPDTGIDYISIYRGDQPLMDRVREILWALSQQEISLSIQVM